MKSQSLYEEDRAINGRGERERDLKMLIGCDFGGKLP